MGTTLKIPTRYDHFRAFVYRVLHWPYAVACLLGYVLVCFLVVGYLSKAPVYQSDIALVLPGTGSNSNLNIADIGQVTSQTSTPFVSSSINPILNYKEIIAGLTVVSKSSKKVGVSFEEFGKPRVVLTEQTSILNITVEGPSPLQAQQKALALYESFQEELTRLRSDEATHRERSMKSVLEQYRANLAEARQKIINFQQHSVVIATTQMAQLTATQASVREKKMYARAEQHKLENYVDQLSRDLGVSPALAGQAFALQSDSEFRGYLAELSSSASQLSEYSSRWGESHPKVKAMRERYEYARGQLVNRSRNLLGIQSGELLANMDLQTSPNRAQLFSDLVNSYAHLKGSEAELQDLSLTEESVEEKLRIFARESSELERLENDYQLALAVFTSIVGKLESGKSDIFASYPVVQLLMPPSQKFDPKSPRTTIAFAAGGVGCFFITLTMLVLWQRRYLLHLLLKKS
jgi:uncharacterized protein involved in exopolysaccharide biosynthesis